MTNADNLSLELRRGVIILAVLSQLKEAQYGYSLLKLMAEKGFEIEQGTLYPLLRRLEERGLLQSEWQVDGSRPRRYYSISPGGEKALPKLKAEWKALVKVIDGLLA
ncbi:MAG: PadR family transcriptional regulator [Chloroflexi bacterium]|nr:MAG: PadR family transcriptional regulator [Chloroflexota bacterium]MBL1194220.1 PadR family transcriptional regulator [Chloroflexota bacterium]NOH11513.1 PadR family transcriptional regulator [Chloroflexota bacterium]